MNNKRVYIVTILNENICEIGNVYLDIDMAINNVIKLSESFSGATRVSIQIIERELNE